MMFLHLVRPSEPLWVQAGTTHPMVLDEDTPEHILREEAFRPGDFAEMAVERVQAIAYQVDSAGEEYSTRFATVRGLMNTLDGGEPWLSESDADENLEEWRKERAALAAALLAARQASV